jgi:phosphoenolpyruvate synthase/pyruvate phosphate dikinase
MEFVRNFTGLSKTDAHLAGGKGASLGEMTQAGIPVPPGFVVLADSFEHFIRETDLVQEIDAILHRVNHKEIHTVEAASEQIRALILNVEMPQDIADEISKSFKKLDTKYVAVRSSATAEDGMDHAWAGQLESYLNTTEDDVLTKVKLCWSSLFTPRAIFYRFEKGLHTTKISVAVVVQKMVESEVSGIAFSVHPVTEDWNQLIIEAGFGLGEAIVSGSVTPDSYVVEKEPRKIIDISVSTQDRALYRAEQASKEHGNNEWRNIPEPKASSQVLDEKQILELSAIILNIEKHYGFPCDIEWAYEAGKFYIVQSRPITTLAKREEIKDERKEIVELLKRTDCQIDWSGPFSLFHYSLAAKGYFDTFNKIFGKNLSFVYLSYTKGTATAYLPANEYQELGVYLAKKARDEKFRKEWIKNFKEIADKIKALLKKLHGQAFFAHSEELQSLYDYYTAYQVAAKMASNFLSKPEDQPLFNEFENARKYSETLFGDADEIISEAIKSVLDSTSGKYTDEQLSFLLLEELLQIVQGKNMLLPRELQNRFDRSGIYTDGRKYTILNQTQADEVETEWSKVSEDGILSGNSAFPGIVTGRVRVLKNYKGATLEAGEILVTGMTDPNFVPLMKKAAAIITDGGGLLCHAAIVARELKKPCIIGTKFATKILKDGDIVEVDADKGIIKIVTSKQPDKFIKAYTRDTTVIIQQGWNDCVATPLYSDIPNPFLPPVIHYVKNGVIEIWENEKATEWIKDSMQSFARKHEDKLFSFMDRYEKDLEEMKKYWAKGPIADPIEFEKYVAKVFKVMKGFDCMYFASIDDRTPPHIKMHADKIREADTYFDSNDKLMRASLLTMYPHLKGYETCVLRSEISNPPSVEVLKLRKTNYVFMGETYAEAIPLSNFLSNNRGYHFDIEKLPEDRSILRGQVGNKGKAKGVVRLMNRKEQIGEAQEGDILVSAMTTPDFVPAMKKAAAIITDEGGITCHAAIVARELNKPCVIGTKIATEILKDGDIVEVDADKGIVRIIK